MYLQTHIPRKQTLGNQAFDICDLYRGNPWGLEPLNATCSDGSGGQSGGGGRFSAERQFPAEGFIGPSGAAGWGLIEGEEYRRALDAKGGTTAPALRAGGARGGSRAAEGESWLTATTLIKGIPNWMLLAGGGLFGLAALRN